MNKFMSACVTVLIVAAMALPADRPAKGSVTFGSSKTFATLAPNAKAASNAFVEVAKFVKSSVVSVTSQKILKRQAYPNFYGSPFDFFFGNPFNQQNPRQQPQQVPEQEFKQQGLGSGVIVSKEGYILTNNHVVEGADEISISLPGNKDVEAEIVGTDSLSDVAVLKLKEDVKDLPVAAMGNSDSVDVGEWVLAIGNPFSKQLSQTVTAGIVSAKGRNAGINRYENFIQTDASINPGNSGGALVNLKGEVIGINTAIMSRSGGNVGIGFAIPINMARKVMEDLIYVGKVSRGWLGIEMQPIDDNTIAEALGLKDNYGVLVNKVVPGSPADKAGIKSGDVIISIDGTKIRDIYHLKDLIGNTAPNTKIDLAVVREKKEKHLKVVLAELAPGAEQGAVSDEADAEDLIGLAVRDMSPDLAQQYGLDPDDKGALITGISMKSSAGNTDLRVGDLIQKINNIEIKDVSNYRAAIKKAGVGQSLLMYVKRGKDNFFVGVKIREKKKD